ncbi:MAG: hypothetical protein U0736_11805 [Gemmataceae bacterium]
MSDPLSLPATAQPRPSGDSPWWLLGLLALIGWQAWLTLGLFDVGRSWRRIVDPEPIVSGRHPLHLYHGYLGARALWGRLSLSCYDPAFYAGYPKTPVFDPGSRPAEAALAAVGGAYQPEAYKTAVAVVCLLVPWILYLAARWTGAVRGVAVLAALLAVLVWWGRPGRSAVEAGDVDLLLATLMTLATAGLLIRYHRDPDVRGLLGITAGGAIAWFAHPLLCLLAAPLFLLYYLTVGPKHRLAWHTPLFLALFAAVGANAFWLGDWVSYWWIRVPPCRDVSLLTGRTVRAFWEAPLWGGGEDRVVAVLLIAASVVGTALLERAGCRATGRMFGAGVVGLLALAVAGVSCEPFARLGACHLLPTGAAVRRRSGSAGAGRAGRPAEPLDTPAGCLGGGARPPAGGFRAGVPRPVPRLAAAPGRATAAADRAGRRPPCPAEHPPRAHLRSRPRPVGRSPRSRRCVAVDGAAAAADRARLPGRAGP